MMLKTSIYVTLAAIILVTAVSLATPASAAKKKLTYDEAYAKCKTLLDKEGQPGVSLQPNARYTRGAGCMKKYGYKL